MPIDLYLIRHGETAWSISGQHTGTTDLPLTEQGERDSCRLGERLGGVAFARVFTSPRQRATRTCELAGFGAVAEVDPDLAEWDYGDYEGLRTTEILAGRPAWNVFRDGCPNGETPLQVSERADAVLRRLREAGGTIAVFSHGHFTRALAARWLGLPVDIGQHLLLGPASVSRLGYEHDDPAAPVIALWNARVTGS